jgi:putative lipoprotein
MVEDIAGRGVLDRSQTTMRFDREGRVSGGTGCNTFTGTVTVEGDQLTFSPLAMTRRACESGPMEQEIRFLGAIESVRSYATDDKGRLRLKAADGNAVLRLVRAQ